MKTFHNPDRFMSDLRQVLSQGRKRIGLLVGAGAPMSIRVDDSGSLVTQGGHSLMPGVEALTTQAIEGLEGSQRDAAEAIRKELGASANIETILTRIRLLQQALGPAQVYGLDSEGYIRNSLIQHYSSACVSFSSRLTACCSQLDFPFVMLTFVLFLMRH